MTHLPNLLTVLRIFLCPLLIVVLHQQHFDYAIAIFFIAGITDALDGWIAKRYSLETRLGALLDPLADKLLIASSYVMVTLLGLLPFWFLVLVLFRDLVILGGLLVLTMMYDLQDIKMQPNMVSKLNTLLQIVLLLMVLINHAGWLSLHYIEDYLMVAVVITTILSGVIYIWSWGFQRHRVFNDEKPSL